MIDNLICAYDFGRHYLKRGKTEYRHFYERIESEGGTITKANRVGLFLKSPFAGLRKCPLYYCFNVDYKERSGNWFIAASDNNPNGEWVWSDSNTRTDLPVVRNDGARVDNSVIALEYFTGNLIAVCIILLFIWTLFHFFIK